MITQFIKFKLGIKSMISRTHIDVMLSLKRAYERLRQRYSMDGRTKDLNGYELLILLSADEPTTPKNFADSLSCKPAQITGYLSRLEELGFLKRKVSKIDKRSFQFQLTKYGKQKSVDLIKVTRDIYDENTQLNESENISLIQLLGKL